MMKGVVQAETMKLLHHRGIWGLVWVFPVGLVLLWVIATLLRVAHITPTHAPATPTDAARWMADSAITWKLVSSSFGRYMIAGFTALAFAGEYGWNTWKLIVPLRRRGALIAAKYGVVLSLEMSAFLLTALLAVLIALLDSVIRSEAIPPGVTLGALLAAHAPGFAVALISTALTIAYVAAGAIFFRSTMAAVIVGIVAVTLDQLVLLFAVAIPEWLLLALPGVHLANLKSWITAGHGASLIIAESIVQIGWMPSTVTLAAWIAGLIAVTSVRFLRQDLN